MNRIVASACLLIVCAYHSLMAQEIKVVNLMEIPSDSTAILNPVYDINNESCAVLKVYAGSISELTFSGMIVGDVIKNSSNIYLLHIPNKTKRIKYRHPEFLPGVIDFTEFQLSVEGGKVYSATLKEDSVESPSSNTIQYLTFKSEYPLKSFLVNGEEWTCKKDTNIYIARKMVPLGLYNYVAYTEDGRVYTGIVEVKNAKINKTVKIE